MSDFESQKDEVEALQSIFTEEEFYSFNNEKITRGHFNAFVSVPEGYTVFYRKTELPEDNSTLNGKHEETKIFGDDKTLEKSMKVENLPPIQLSFELPADYPSKSHPVYTISCPWLTFVQLRKLSEQLLKIWSENKGFVVLYSWAQFLKDECLSFLELEKSLDVTAVEEAQLSLSAEQEENLVTEEVREGKSGLKEDMCTVLDVNSGSDKEKEKQALFDCGPTKSRENSDQAEVKSSLLETNGPNGPSEEIDVTQFIAFDQGLEVKRPLYCTTSQDQDIAQVPEKELSKPGPSSSRVPKSDKENTTQVKIRKNDFHLLQKSVICPPSTGSLWNRIMDYDKMRRKKDFDYRMFCCAVCFEEKVGSQCMEVEKCNHVFCRDCLTCFLNVRILEGKVKQLSCPETDCDSELLHSEIRSLVSPELFAKYDSLLLSTTLDTLNVTYCPRKFCQYPVSSDNETMALCPQCDYCFCPFCKMVYHGVEPCRFKLNSEETNALIKEYENGSESRKSELEKRYGRKYLQQLLNTVLSQSWISDNSKPCPKCNASIERTYGCNKMVCLRCNTPFCWLCLAILDHLNPYHHFQEGRCAGKLYLGMQIEGGGQEEFDEDEVHEEYGEDDFFDDRLYDIHNGLIYL